jgi:hypothetical protein
MIGKIFWQCNNCGTPNRSSIRASKWKVRCVNPACHHKYDMHIPISSPKVGYPTAR